MDRTAARKAFRKDSLMVKHNLSTKLCAKPSYESV
jgi:hypothetical protein